MDLSAPFAVQSFSAIIRDVADILAFHLPATRIHIFDLAHWDYCMDKMHLAASLGVTATASQHKQSLIELRN